MEPYTQPLGAPSMKDSEVHDALMAACMTVLYAVIILVLSIGVLMLAAWWAGAV